MKTAQRLLSPLKQNEKEACLRNAAPAWLEAQDQLVLLLHLDYKLNLPLLLLLLLRLLLYLPPRLTRGRT